MSVVIGTDSSMAENPVMTVFTTVTPSDPLALRVTDSVRVTGFAPDTELINRMIDEDMLVFVTSLTTVRSVVAAT